MGAAGHHGGGAGQVHIAEKVELGLIAVAVPEVECPGGDARRVPRPVDHHQGLAVVPPVVEEA